MSVSSDDDDYAEGPLFLVAYVNEAGGKRLYAQWNGFTFDLYGDEQRTLWYGEAESLDDPVDLLMDVMWIGGHAQGDGL